MRGSGIRIEPGNLPEIYKNPVGNQLLVGIILGLVGLGLLALSVHAILFGRARTEFKDEAGGPLKISIQLEGSEETYKPGDTIRASITLSGEKAIYVRQLSASLVLLQHYKPGIYMPADPEFSPPADIHVEDVVAEQVLLTTEQLPASCYRTFRADLELPENISPAYPSSQQSTPDTEAMWRMPGLVEWPSLIGNIGMITHSWLVRVSLVRPLGPVLIRQLSLPVTVPVIGAFLQPGEFGELSHPGKVWMSFLLPRLEWVEGEVLQGRLLIRPLGGMEVDAIRIELEHQEHIHLGKAHRNLTGTAQTLSLARQTMFQPDQAIEYPFELTLPKLGLPTLHTERATACWVLRGVLSRRLKRDFYVKTEILVYQYYIPYDEQYGQSFSSETRGATS